AAGFVSLARSVDATTQPARIAGMAQGTPTASSPGAPGPLPAVTLELHYGSARPTTHELHEVSFLLGTVPGCDLRLSGANLPSVICLISRRSSCVTLRRLAPVLPILVNDKPITTSRLADGDRIAIGAVELHVSVRMPDPAAKEAVLHTTQSLL